MPTPQKHAGLEAEMYWDYICAVRRIPNCIPSGTEHYDRVVELRPGKFSRVQIKKAFPHVDRAVLASGENIEYVHTRITSRLRGYPESPFDYIVAVDLDKRQIWMRKMKKGVLIPERVSGKRWNLWWCRERDGS